MKYKFEILNHKLNYQGFHNIELYDFRYEKFNGGTSNIVSRELSRRTSCVGLLPYDPVRQEVILIEQIRVGPLANNEYPWLLEIIAGIVDNTSTNEENILRETQEEANCNISKLIPIYDYYLSPGGSSEKIQLYIGITDTSTAGGVFGLDSEEEDIKVHVVKLDKVFKMLESGEINNASTIVALQWLKLNIDKINNI